MTPSYQCAVLVQIEEIQGLLGPGAYKVKNESEQVANIIRGKKSIFVLFLSSEGMFLFHIMMYEGGYWFKIAVDFLSFSGSVLVILVFNEFLF